MANVFVQTYGCSLNVSDSEVIKGLLKKSGFEIVENKEDATIIIINTCGVKGPTQAKFFKYLEEVSELRKPIVIAGCLPKMIPEELSGYSMIGPHQLNKIKDVVEETLNGEIVSLIADANEKRLNTPKIRKNPVIEIIPICRGCTGNCAYCIVKKARGSLVSYPKEEILEQAKKAIKEGVKEIWLTAQDTGCYGKGTIDNLAFLIRSIAALDGDFMIRVGMANPNHIMGMLDQLIEAFQHPKVFKFLHIPVQAGNDEVLKNMNRRYSVEDFKNIVQAFREEIPEITIATDVICGFPGETKEQSMETAKLISDIKPDIVNVSRFWPRPGTEAEKMENQIHGQETKNRSTYITSTFDWIALQLNKRWRKWEGEVIIDGLGKDNTWLGRNYCYKLVVVEGNFKIGDKVKVRITGTEKHYLFGEVLQ